MHYNFYNLKKIYNIFPYNARFINCKQFVSLDIINNNNNLIMYFA